MPKFKNDTERAAHYRTLLEEIRAIAEDRADTNDGKDGQPVPNDWMRVQTIIDDTLDVEPAGIGGSGTTLADMADYLAAGRPLPNSPQMARCGTCGRRWDDAKVTAYTPTPAGRCPFEAWHEST